MVAHLSAVFNGAKLRCEGELNSDHTDLAQGVLGWEQLMCQLTESCVMQRCLQLIRVLNSNPVGALSVLNTNKADIVGHQDETDCFYTLVE